MMLVMKIAMMIRECDDGDDDDGDSDDGDDAEGKATSTLCGTR